MEELFKSPLFGITISLIAFEIGCLIYKKTKLAIFNPLFISILLVILFLAGMGINVEDYNVGGKSISFFLGPVTVILAVPLYKKIKLLKAHALPIIAGISIGSLIGITTIIVLCHVLGMTQNLGTSMIPKSVTVPIGIEISKQIGGMPAVTVVASIFTGIMGSIIGPYVCKMFRIKDDVAVGVAIGTASHAIGTTKAIELGETQGAMSGLAIGIAGLITVFLAPVLLNVVSSLF